MGERVVYRDFAALYLAAEELKVGECVVYRDFAAHYLAELVPLQVTVLFIIPLLSLSLYSSTHKYSLMRLYTYIP